jgi:outer membrane protein
MKRLLFIALFIAGAAGSVVAQNYMVVDSEKIFKSIAEYNNAITTLDNLAESYQQQVDSRFEEVESLYNSYQQQAASLTAATRQTRENQIITQEEEAAKFQEEIFGNEGILMKKRLELIEPIQKRVFEVIERYASQNGYDLVLDAASNPTLLYKSTKVDHTDAVIKLL